MKPTDVMSSPAPIGETLHRLLHGYRRVLRQSYAEHHIRLAISHIRVLKCVARTNDATARQIAEYMRQDKGRIARLLHDLETEALIDRRPHAVDHRSRQLILTEDGQALLERIEAIETQTATCMASGLSSRDLHRFNELAESMIANLDQVQDHS